PSFYIIFTYTILPPPSSTLFPYTTLFRSLLAVRQTVGAGEDGLAAFDDEHSTCKFILRGAFVEFVPKRRKRAILGEARHRELSGSGNEPKVELRNVERLG